MKTALVAGASGLVGSELVKKLIASNEYGKIHLLLRRRLNIQSDKIVEHLIEFNELNKWKIDDTIDHAFCTLGTTIKNAKTKECSTSRNIVSLLCLSETKLIFLPKLLLVTPYSFSMASQLVLFVNNEMSCPT